MWWDHHSVRCILIKLNSILTFSLLFFSKGYKSAYEMTLILQIQKVTELWKKTKVFNMLSIFFFPLLFALIFHGRKIKTRAEYMRESKAPWRHSYKPIPSLFIALRSKRKDEIPPWKQNKRQKHNIICSQQAGKSLAPFLTAGITQLLNSMFGLLGEMILG